MSTVLDSIHNSDVNPDLLSETPINPASAASGPAGGPIAERSPIGDLRIPDPVAPAGPASDAIAAPLDVVREVLNMVYRRWPDMKARKIVGVNSRDVFAFQLGEKLFFMSWYDYIPNMDDVESSMH